MITMNENEKKELFENQKKTLDTFLETHAISKEQYDKSLIGLAEKMGIKLIDENDRNYSS